MGNRYIMISVLRVTCIFGVLIYHYEKASIRNKPFFGSGFEQWVLSFLYSLSGTLQIFAQSSIWKRSLWLLLILILGFCSNLTYRHEHCEWSYENEGKNIFNWIICYVDHMGFVVTYEEFTTSWIEMIIIALDFVMFPFKKLLQRELHENFAFAYAVVLTSVWMFLIIYYGKHWAISINQLLLFGFTFLMCWRPQSKLIPVISFTVFGVYTFFMNVSLGWSVLVEGPVTVRYFMRWYSTVVKWSINFSNVLFSPLRFQISWDLVWSTALVDLKNL